ncbi:hypothetical protein R69927_00429 [Paraburkholderia domus]|uniref:zinc ribbon domain-containing protein n=1 Tax=Paraburkholderia domus TaxID=2793075 RepID=UPI0019148FE4|nr:zinc ribbon domain-containing protein [Paraburkholderia domus]MBK5084614.1 hypothetical protein [Burkholderia sp. R-69927]CAE6816018.1 hypothetical protein R69927_00429 [Paraburkholderia domus]
MDRTFENPLNGHKQTVGIVNMLLAILFGPIYFAIAGAWAWALVEFLLAALLYASLGAPATLLVVPMQFVIGLGAGAILAKKYLARGWREVGNTSSPHAQGPVNKGLAVLFDPITGSAEPVGTRPIVKPTVTKKEPSEKVCPQCAESVKFAAKVCRYCRHEFVFEQRDASL